MADLPRYDSSTLCPDYRFVRVVSADGVFFDLVRKWRVRAHIFRLEQDGLAATTMGRASVPPCVFRDFTELDGSESFHKSVWKDGTQFLFSEEDAPSSGGEE